MNNQLIPVFAGELSGVPVQLVDARLLHTFLDVADRFADWIKRRIEEYSFIENIDFLSFSQKSEKPKGGRPTIDYHLTIDMAKELGMFERNEKGRQIRRYFLDLERQATQPQLLGSATASKRSGRGCEPRPAQSYNLAIFP